MNKVLLIPMLILSTLKSGYWHWYDSFQFMNFYIDTIPIRHFSLKILDFRYRYETIVSKTSALQSWIDHCISNATCGQCKLGKNQSEILKNADEIDFNVKMKKKIDSQGIHNQALYGLGSSFWLIALILLIVYCVKTKKPNTNGTNGRSEIIWKKNLILSSKLKGK